MLKIIEKHEEHFCLLSKLKQGTIFSIDKEDWNKGIYMKTNSCGIVDLTTGNYYDLDNFNKKAIVKVWNTPEIILQ